MPEKLRSRSIDYLNFGVPQRTDFCVDAEELRRQALACASLLPAKELRRYSGQK